MDANQIISGVAALKHSLDITKFIFDSSGTLDKAILKSKLAELMESLSTARVEMVAKDEKIAELTAQLKVKAELVYAKPFYYIGDDRHSPYCAQCKDKNSVAIRLYEYSAGYWECKTCNSKYSVNATRPRQLGRMALND